ncbi:unnamed protein product [[Actinomadura] parvosata subsp. kistnae]|uniref:hypothetical protein n=1 Tax=[Actinomadura] parvosata TaxID=1955412 RepID=UPI000D26267B|nr:unnamed protein product [Actinomadura parvosata subsp. kistnae]
MTADLLAKRVTNVLAPQVLVIVMPPLVGLLAQGWGGAAWGWWRRRSAAGCRRR